MSLHVLDTDTLSLLQEGHAAMRPGCPHLSITRTDQVASVVLHLFSEKLRYCPMWIFPRDSRVYNVLAQEFETLWLLNDGA